jgi:CubicO group peptidase (beta-lactamase class C family)
MSMIGWVAAVGIVFLQTASQTAAIEKLDSAITAEARLGFSGVVLIARRDTVLLEKAYGAAAATGVPARDLAFWQASNSKQFTAAAILRLQEMGRLRVTDSIVRFFPAAPADKRNITIHQLLTHTAGFPHAYASDGIVDRAEAVGKILALKLRSLPGEEFSYSNDGYTLLAAIIDIASGTGFDAFVRDSLFSRASLNNTGLWGHERPGSRIASVPDLRRTTSMPATIYQNDKSVGNWGYRGATGAYATASDMYQWVQALRSGRVLKPETVRILLGHHVLVNSDSASQTFDSYGWGTRVRGGRDVTYSHTGSEDWLGHNSVMRFTPDGDVVIVLSNSGEIDRTTWSSRINRLVRRWYDPL